MENDSAAWPLNRGIAALVEGDAAAGGLQSLLVAPYIYSTQAPKGAVPPYMVLADTSEDARNTFGRGGNACVAIVHIWHPEVGQEGVLTIYGRFKKLLSAQAMAVPGHTLYRCTCRLIGAIRDPSDIMHGVVEVGALVANG